ncbi:MAG: hypothetical protein HY575_09160 [candidate division NC10 bacterium]|nr:hypothetical protein [candidate division NC10 bacterium]MBI4392045.1 hypothetical protein [candidate division NC10 bacterium]
MEAWGYIGAAYLLAGAALLVYQVRIRRRLATARQALARLTGERRP